MGCWLAAVQNLLSPVAGAFLDTVRQPVGESLEDVALDSFPGCLLLVLNTQTEVQRVNDCTLRMLQQQRSRVRGYRLQEVVPFGNCLYQMLQRMSAAGEETATAVLELQSSSSAAVCMDVQATVLYDAARQRIGYIITGQPIEGKQELRQLYRLSQREIEIVEEIIQGRSTRAIAAALSISERTVKTHITHIFRKLQVHNRIQLYRLLRDSACISSHPSGRSLLLLPRR
ncbi:helix-turn-helix domain-containing protein [Spirochaeta africana]|nr:helix-turn-helix transcriptional regulator [Spirochaeta africana]